MATLLFIGELQPKGRRRTSRALLEEIVTRYQGEIIATRKQKTSNREAKRAKSRSPGQPLQHARATAA